jgi:hypothetical protein
MKMFSKGCFTGVGFETILLMTTDDDENIGPKNLPLKKGACGDEMWKPGLFDGVNEYSCHQEV